MKETTIAKQWECFDRLVINKNIDRNGLQYKEMKRCFYAGVEALQRIQYKVAEMREEEGLEILSKVTFELANFGKMIKEGKA